MKIISYKSNSMKKIITAFIISTVGITAYSQNIGAAKGKFTSLTVSGNTPAAFDSLKVTGLSGSGNRTVYVDPNGNLKQGNPVPTSINWFLNGNITSGEYIGTNNNQDFIIKTDANGSGGEVMRVTAGGNVGIGTSTPNCIFEVHPPSGQNGICVHTSSLSGGFGVLSATNSNLANAFIVSNSISNSNPFIVKGDGKTGIGTSTIGNNMQLEVAGSVSIYDGNGNTSLFFGREQPTIQALTPANQYGEWGMQYWAGSSKGGNNIGGMNFWKPFGSDGIGGNAFLFLQDDGNVGIGTENPDPQYKLSVNGGVRAKKVVVEIGWADYVFKKDYKLLPISELEKYVSINNHLPNIPSSQEIETKGLDLGSVQAKQMEKIEELTLYIIEVNKKN